MDILRQVRQELLAEATASPAMLADLAGLEHYISESYANRTFIELLQNADGAKADEVVFIQGEDWVLAANTGRTFSEQDFRSICRSASSKKSRRESIGFRGIGFKSVVGISSRVHLISGNLSATFDRDLTREALGTRDVPVPLVRVPHPLSLNDPSLHQNIDALRREGFRTFFALSGIDSVQVENEFEKFDSDHLLFLRNVAQVRAVHSRERRFTCRRNPLDEKTVELLTTSPAGQESWKIISSGPVSIAVATEAGSPVPLERSESLVHAFLPTQEETGIPARINGDFSTDPSRTRIVLDHETDLQLESVANLIVTLIEDSVPPDSKTDPALLECLIPYIDDVTLQFERHSFRVALAKKLHERLSVMRDRLALAPVWLNETDSRELEKALGRPVISRHPSKPSALESLAAFCGLQSAGPDSVFKTAETGAISPQGFAELVAHVLNSIVPTSTTFNDLYNLPLWPSPEGSLSLGQIADRGVPLNDVFIDLVKKSGLDLSLLRQRAVAFDDRLINLLPDHGVSLSDVSSSSHKDRPQTTKPNSVDPFAPAIGGAHTVNPSQRGVPKWRSSEQSVHELLENELGFRVEDRTRQNIGYDLWAHDGSREFFVEVKSLSYPGEPFTLTPNEDSFARDHGRQYVLALVLRTEETINVQFISSPRDSLQFERQCRQWVWECSYYDFDAQYIYPA